MDLFDGRRGEEVTRLRLEADKCIVNGRGETGHHEHFCYHLGSHVEAMKSNEKAENRRTQGWERE